MPTWLLNIDEDLKGSFASLMFKYHVDDTRASPEQSDKAFLAKRDPTSVHPMMVLGDLAGGITAPLPITPTPPFKSGSW